jgi:hypothetical protein
MWQEGSAGQGAARGRCCVDGILQRSCGLWSGEKWQDGARNAQGPGRKAEGEGLTHRGREDLLRPPLLLLRLIISQE